MTDRKPLLFWSIAALVVLSDVATKRWASASLVEHVPREVIGDWVRLTLTHNRGAAFGLSLGSNSNVLFAIIAGVALIVIYRLYRAAAPRHHAYIVALAALGGGALSNLLDRVRWDGGVVDFIDVGVGTLRFWTFNVADAAVTCGAIALLLVEWRRSAARKRLASSPPLVS